MPLKIDAVKKRPLVLSVRHWLMKTEPSVYSIDDLARDKKTCWEGVRNFQARNFMRDAMRVGDLVLFYHSNAEPSGVAGIARVCKAGYPEKGAPPWFMVDVEFIEKFPHFVSLAELKANPSLKGMMVVKRGIRLSVQPVNQKHFDEIRSGGLH